MQLVVFSVRTSEHGRPGDAALEGDHMTCLSLLLRRGADLEAKNHNQQTLLQCIRKKYGQTRTDKLLKESGNERKIKERIDLLQFPQIFSVPFQGLRPIIDESVNVSPQCMHTGFLSSVSKIIGYAQYFNMAMRLTCQN